MDKVALKHAISIILLSITSEILPKIDRQINTWNTYEIFPQYKKLYANNMMQLLQDEGACTCKH